MFISIYFSVSFFDIGANVDEKAYLDSLYTLWFSTMRNNGISHDGDHYSVASLKLAKQSNNDMAMDASYRKDRDNRPTYQSVYRVNELNKVNTHTHTHTHTHAHTQDTD